MSVLLCFDPRRCYVSFIAWRPGVQYRADRKRKLCLRAGIGSAGIRHD